MISFSKETKRGAVTYGKNIGLATPCQANASKTEALNELFETTLPE